MTDKQEPVAWIGPDGQAMPAAIYDAWKVADSDSAAEWSPLYLAAPPAQPADEVKSDHDRLVRELDVLLNGEAGAARQASLCDIVSQLKAAQPAPAQRLSDARIDELCAAIYLENYVSTKEYERIVARAIEAAIVPPGYVVVPVEPTRAMLDAGSAIWDDTLEIYRAMIAAAKDKP